MSGKNEKTILLIMLFLAVMLPVFTFFGKQNQENRSLAYVQLGQSCKLTSACQPPLICSSGVCKNGTARTGNQGLNQSCSSESDCRSPYVCYSNVCKVRSGGECSRSGDCFGNHYCSRSNNHCRKIDDYNLGDYSVEGVSVSSMLGRSNPPSTAKPTTITAPIITRVPTRTSTIAPTRTPTIPIVTVIPSAETKISFKIAFAGIVPGAECIDEYLLPETKLELDITNVPSNIHKDKIPASFQETNEIDSKGNRVFKVAALSLDKNIFGSVNEFNYIKIKGPWHLKRKMCLDGQYEKLPEPTVCNISLESDIIYDFSEYTLLSGDINQDGLVNTLDLSSLKSWLKAGTIVTCGINGDLNMDGIVNSLDLNLIKDTLTERDDE